MWKVKLSKRAIKDRNKIVSAGLGKKVKNLITVLEKNPYRNPPPYEKHVGELKDFYSRRINIQHRLVYTVHKDEKIVVIRSIWTHYE